MSKYHRRTMKPSLIALACIISGCAMTRNEPAPLTCSLAPSELTARRGQLLPGLIERAKHVTELENGLRLRFDSRPGLLADLARVVDQERTCCSFLRFNLVADAGTGPVTFEVTGPPGTLEVLRSL